MIVENMSQAPIIGYYNENIVEFAKKVATAYNSSVKNLNTHSLLGYDLDLIPEIKGKKANFDLEKGTLEIILSKNTQVILPSVYTEAKYLYEYFNFKNENQLDEILLEKNILQKNSLSEAITVKGAAEKLKSGMKTAASILRGKSEIEIENPETINDICEGIEKDLRSQLNINVPTENLIKTITGFVRVGDKRQLQDLYDVLFDSAIESKYIDDVVADIHKLIQKKTDEDGNISKLKDKDIIKVFAKAYGDSDPKAIKQRMQEQDVLKKFNKIKRLTVNWNSVIINSLKMIPLTYTALSTAIDGVVATALKYVSFIMKFINGVCNYFLGTEDSVWAKIWEGEFVDAFTTFGQKSITFVTSIFSGGMEFISDSLCERVTELEGTLTFGILKFAVAFVIILQISATMRTINNAYFRIEDDTKTEGQLVALAFTKEELKSKFGFDKILATDAILATIVANIKPVLEEESNISKQEKKRLKDLVRAIHGSHKKYTSEGIRTFVQAAKKI